MEAGGRPQYMVRTPIWQIWQFYQMLDLLEGKFVFGFIEAHFCK